MNGMHLVPTTPGLTRYLVLLLLPSLCLVAPALPSWQTAEHHHHDCVVGHREIVSNLQAKISTWQEPGHGQWHDEVFVMPYVHPGSYDRTIGAQANAEPRRWVAESFFDSNPDTYDFLVVFTSFDWDAGPANGLYWSIKNDVQGIGLDLFDSSSYWSSERLQGYIDARALEDYTDDDGELNEGYVSFLLNHELGHRWLAHARFLDAGQVSSALLDVDSGHWSYLLDSEASFMYGSEWSDNGDGSFTATAVQQRYSHLDLYLMGIMRPEKVPPLTLLQSPEVSASQLPRLGDTIDAATRAVTIDDLLAAMGPRSPAADETSHQHRIALVYLVDPDHPPTADELALLGEIKASWKKSFFRQTGGHGVIDIGRFGSAGTPGAVVDLQKAIQWLVSMGAANDGRFSDSAASWVRETAASVMALTRVGGQLEAVNGGLYHLGSSDPAASQTPSIELEARRVEVLAEHGTDELDDVAAALQAHETAAGGWPAFQAFSADTVTTARAVRALAATGRLEAASRGWQWLVARQLPDGGWGQAEHGPSLVWTTHEVLLAARSLDSSTFWLHPSVQAGVDWLLAGRSQGGFGDGFPNVEQTSLFLLLALDQDVDQLVIDEAVDLLCERQLEDGSWQGSTYLTALALDALVSFALPDPRVDGQELFSDPPSPYEDQAINLTVAVRNAGLPLAEGAQCSWELWADHSPLFPVWTSPCSLPVIPDVGFVAMSASIDPPPEAGLYELRFIIDPNLRLSEKERGNNVARLQLEVRERPPGVDLALSPLEISVTPPEISSVPQPLDVAGIVRNHGLSDAAAATISVYEGDPSAGILVGSTTVDVPAVGMAAFTTHCLLDSSSSVVLTVVADPEMTTDDERRLDNRAEVAVPLHLAADLELAPGSFSADPPMLSVGESVQLQLAVRNGGTLEVEGFQVELAYQSGPGPEYQVIALLELDDRLAPGETMPVSLSWRPSIAGDPLPLRVMVDPGDALGDVDRGDNEAATSIVVAPSLLADLEVRADLLHTSPDPPLEGQTYRVSATISNPTPNAAGPFVAELWLDEPQTGVLLGSESLPGLDAGESLMLEADWEVDRPVDRQLWVVADPLGAVNEINEDNNLAFIDNDVRSLADLALTRGGIEMTPGFPVIGDAVHLEVLVANLGDQTSLPTQLELLAAGGAVVDLAAVPAMIGSEELRLGLDLPAGVLTGVTTLTVRVDGAGLVQEGSELNNEVGIDLVFQEGDLLVSHRVLSPNGDGRQDTTTIFCRSGSCGSSQGSILILAESGRLVRTLELEPAAESVIWDGTTDRGNLAEDGIYTVEAGDLSTWVAVDTNRTAITHDLEQRLLVGFVNPRVPGDERPDVMSPDRNIERSWFTSLLTNPRTDELYAVEQYHQAGSPWSSDTYTLWKLVGDELVKLGEPPQDGRDIIGADTAGTIFVTGEPGMRDPGLMRLPGLGHEPLDAPGWSYDPWISPDGQWLLWVSPGSTRLVLRNIDDPGEEYELDSEISSDLDPCGYTVSWLANGQAVVSMASWEGPGAYYRIDLGTSPPQAELIEARPWTGWCISPTGDVFKSSTSGTTADLGPPLGKAELRGIKGPEVGIRLDEETLIWLGLAGYIDPGKAGSDGYQLGSFNLGDGSLIERLQLDLRSSPGHADSPIPLLSNDGALLSVAYDWDPSKQGHGIEEPTAEDQALPGLAAARMIWLDGPEANPIRAAKTTISPVEQYLVRASDGAHRPLPIRLRAARWSPPTR